MPCRVAQDSEEEGQSTSKNFPVRVAENNSPKKREGAQRDRARDGGICRPVNTTPGLGMEGAVRKEILPSRGLRSAGPS